MNRGPCPNNKIGTSIAYQAQYIQFSHIHRVLEYAVCTIFTVPPAELRAPQRRCARTAFARQVAMYLAHVAFGLTLTRVGALFGRDRTTAAYGCTVVEDRREDPALDRALAIVEAALRSAHGRTQTGGEGRA